MFKKFANSHVPNSTRRFNLKEDVSGQNQVKSSVVRNIRQKLIERYPGIEQHLDEILPKKSPLLLLKWFTKLD